MSRPLVLLAVLVVDQPWGRSSMCRVVLGACLGLLVSAPATAEVVNPRVTTDASIDTFSVDTVVAQIVKPAMSDEQKAIACWRFMLDHFYHWYPPREPDTASEVRDFAKAINSYGFGPCFVNAPVLTALWEAAGLQTRSWTLRGHSVPEVKYGGAWHMLDADARGWHRRADGQIASVEDLARDPKLHTDPPGRSDPFYPFAKPDEVAAPLEPWAPPGRLMDLYLSRRNNARYNRRAVWGHPMYLTLRSGEQITLCYANEGKFLNAGFPKRKLKAGPLDVTRRYTYGNGRLLWQPHLASIPERELLWLGSRNVELRDGKLAAADPRQPAVAVFRVWCPYVLVESRAELRTAGGGPPQVELSVDGGVAWAELGRSAALDLTPHVAGRYEYQLRVTLGGASLRGIAFDSLFQHSQLAFPRLRLGKNTVTILRGPDEGVVQLVRARGNHRHPRYLVASDNLAPAALAPATTEGEPAYAIYRLSAPAPLTALSVGAQLSLGYHHQQWAMALYSLDRGKTWKPIWKRVGNPNRQNAQFEQCKRIRLDNPARAREVLIKFLMARMRPILAVNSIRLYAFYRQPQPPGTKLAVEVAWQEKHGAQWVERSQSVVTARFPHELTITCGGEAVRLSRIDMRPGDRSREAGNAS